MFIVIVGSKSDLAANRAVPAIFANKLKKDIPNCRFTIETSAFENIDTIQQLFDQVGREIVDGGFYNI